MNNEDHEPQDQHSHRVSSFRIEDILSSSPSHTRATAVYGAVGPQVQTSTCNLSFGVDRILAAQGIFGLSTSHHDLYYKLHSGYWSPAYTCYTLPGHGCEACSSSSAQLPYMDMRLHDAFSPYQRYSQSPTEQQPTESLSSNQTRPRKPRRPWTRAVFSNLQRKGLEKRFQVQKYLTKADRHQLASMLGLSDNQVKVWFQNRRMKWRQEARESVSSTNPDDEEEIQS